VKSEELKHGSNLTESFKEGYGSKKGCSSNDNDDGGSFFWQKLII
jgi:hypothetical protein